MPNNLPTTTVKLNPGFTFIDSKGQQHRIDEAEIGLLTRAERKVILAVKDDPVEQDDVALLKRVKRLGPVTDSNEIRAALEYLPGPDEERIRLAVEEFEKTFEAASKPAPPKAKRIVEESDILSSVFALNPGVVINGKAHKSCVVRLLRRGEWKQIDAEADEEKKNDLALWLSIVQLGDLTEVELEHIDLLASGDEERINEEVKRLEDSFRPDRRKHTCPECNASFTD
jgi:hypothetical protein